MNPVVFSKGKVIISAPAQWMDETPSTSGRKPPSKPISSRLSGKMPHPGGRGPSGHRSKHGLGGVVHKERPWEHRMGSSRSTECPAGAWDGGPTGSAWDAIIAKHRSPGPSSGIYPKEAGKKTRKNMKLDPDSQLCSDEDSDS